MKFHPPHISPAGHEFSIGDNGTHVRIQFAKATPVELTAEQAMELRSWLGAAELRTSEDAAKLGPAPAEINSGVKVEMNDATILKDGTVGMDGSHEFANSPLELAELQAKAKANLDEQNNTREKIRLKTAKK